MPTASKIQNAFSRFRLSHAATGGTGVVPPPTDTGWVIYEEGGDTGYVVSDEGERLTYELTPEEI